MPLFSATSPLTLPELAASLRSREALRLPPEVEAYRLASPAQVSQPPAADSGPLDSAGGAGLVVAYACGTGAEVPTELVRRLLLLQVQRLGRGPGSVAGATAKRLLDFFNRDVWPVVYEQGPPETALAHLCLPLLGLGEVNYQGYRLAASDVLGLFSWEPLALQATEELALLGGAPLALAYATEALERTQHLFGAVEVLEALSAEALGTTELAPSASRAALAYVTQAVQAACNAGPASPNILSAAGLLPNDLPLYGQPLALALDHLALAVAALGHAAERRTHALLRGQAGLPVGLVPGAGVGLLGALRTAASLVSQNQQLYTPATEVGDARTTAPTQVRQLVENAEQLLGIELLAAAQAHDLRPAPTSRPALAAVVAAFREHVTFVPRDRVLAPDLHRAARFVREYPWA